MATLTEAVRDMIISALDSMEVTSADPTHINRLIQVNDIQMPDLEQYLVTENDKEDLLGSTINAKAKSGEFFGTKAFAEQGVDVTNVTKEQAQNILEKAGINPQDLIRLGLGQGNVASVFGGVARAGASFVPPLMIAILVAELLPRIIKDLQKPGGILDKRFKNDITKEVAGFMDRQTRQNTRIGDKQVIIQQFSGFRSYNGHASSNTSKIITETSNRVLDIGLFDRAQGV